MKRTFVVLVCFVALSALGAFGQQGADISLTQVQPVGEKVGTANDLCLNPYAKHMGRQSVLWDNGDTDGSNGYSNADQSVFGFYRRLLDDFEVPPGETWIIYDFHSYQIWDSLPPGSGTDYQLTFWSDNAGAPGAPLGPAVTTVSYAEIATGRTWFGRPEYETQYVFEPIELTEGTYWIEANVIGPENNFFMVHAWPPSLSECWVNYEDYPPIQPGVNLFGVEADLAYWLTGEIKVEELYCKGEVLYGATTSGPSGPSDLYRIDGRTGTPFFVGPIGFNHVSAMDFQPGTGRLLATGQRPSDDTPVLISIDTNTGLGTEIGPTGLSIVVTDMSFRSDGVLFAYDAIPGGHLLYTIDPATGISTLVGNTMLAFAGGNALAFDLNDTLYHSQNIWPPNMLNTLNQANGMVITSNPLLVLPPPDPNACRLNAMDVHPTLGVMYAIVNDNNGTGFWYLATVDTNLLIVTPIPVPTEWGLNAIAWEPILWNNLDTDGSNGYSNMDLGSTGIADRFLLDDFEVPPCEGWIITDFHSYQIWDTQPPGSGWDYVLTFYNDAGGTPDIASGPIGQAITVSYNEVPTGRNWFGRDEYRTDYYFDVIDPVTGFPVCFDGGANGTTYWLEAHVVGPENNFFMIHAWPPSLSECWVNYSDFPPPQPGINLFGVEADLAYKLTHRKVYSPVRQLEVTPEVLPFGPGGPITFSLHAGPANANRQYVLLGGVTGFMPGFNLPGPVNVPLNWDVLTDILLGIGFYFGVTDAHGSDHVPFVIPPLPFPVYIYWAAVMNPPPAWWASNSTILNMY